MHQAEQESIRALMLQAEAVSEAESARARLAESQRSAEIMERELNSIRVQVHEQQVRTRAMQRNPAALAAFNVSHEEARESLDAQLADGFHPFRELAELHQGSEATLGTKDELRRDQANRR